MIVHSTCTTDHLIMRGPSAVSKGKLKQRRRAVRALHSHTAHIIKNLKSDENEMLRGALSALPGALQSGFGRPHCPEAQEHETERAGLGCQAAGACELRVQRLLRPGPLPPMTSAGYARKISGWHAMHGAGRLSSDRSAMIWRSALSLTQARPASRPGPMSDQPAADRRRGLGQGGAVHRHPGGLRGLQGPWPGAPLALVRPAGVAPHAP